MKKHTEQGLGACKALASDLCVFNYLIREICPRHGEERTDFFHSTERDHCLMQQPLYVDKYDFIPLRRIFPPYIPVCPVRPGEGL